MGAEREVGVGGVGGVCHPDEDGIRLQNNIIQVEERKEVSKMMRDIDVAWFCS